MGIISDIRYRFGNKDARPNVLTKAPGFSVTQFTTNNPFTSAINADANLFDQYVLYTFKAIDYVSSKVASSKIRMYDIASSEEVLTKNIYNSDLMHFNPFMNLWEARKLVQMHLMLVGAAFWYIDRDPQEGDKVELYPLEPTKVQIKTNSSGLPSYYSYTDADGRAIEIAFEDIVHFKRMNPSNWFEGISQVKQMSYWTNAYLQGAQYNMSKLGNNINVDKFLVVPGVGDQERDRIENQLRNKYMGVRNAGRTSVVGIAPEIVEMSSGQKDLDYVNGSKMLRQDILAGFGIPEALFFPSATNSNSKEARVLFQSDTLEPILEQEVSVLNEQYIPKYIPSLSKKIMYEYKFDNVVEADKDALFRQANDSFSSGLFTRNQALLHVGEEEIANGNIYKTDTAPVVVDTTSKELHEKSIKLTEEINRILELQDQVTFNEKSIKFTDEQEGIVYQASEMLFQDQFKRAIEYINKVRVPSIRGIFNLEKEIDFTKHIFRDVYSKVIANSNDVGNIEIHQKLLKNGNSNMLDFRSKSISIEAQEEIAAKLDYFATKVNEITREEMRKLMADGLENGFDTTLYYASVGNIFNGYIDGVANIDILNKIGVYKESIGVDDNGTVELAQGNRYRLMYNNIIDLERSNDIDKGQANEAFRALRGVIDPSDTTGREIDAILNASGVNKEKDIVRSRAITIARTEATFARNLGFNDVYTDNPFIKGVKWSASLGNGTRDSHRKINGTEIAIGEVFKLDGGNVRFPGDTSLGAGAGEIVNCRCRITGTVK